jgi:predicted NUDIX family NTP pyrophosphohydrolase
MVKRFEEFGESFSKPTDAAGIAIVLRVSPEPMILLVHPTGASWASPRMGIPKGRIEVGESIQEAAIRETLEETGIKLEPSRLEPEVHTAEVWKGTKFMYNIHYLICNVSEVSEIGLASNRVPKSQLQESEVDWAGFIPVSEAYERVLSSQRIILDRVR